MPKRIFNDLASLIPVVTVVLVDSTRPVLLIAAQNLRELSGIGIASSSSTSFRATTSTCMQPFFAAAEVGSRCSVALVSKMVPNSQS